MTNCSQFVLLSIDPEPPLEVNVTANLCCSQHIAASVALCIIAVDRLKFCVIMKSRFALVQPNTSSLEALSAVVKEKSIVGVADKRSVELCFSEAAGRCSSSSYILMMIGSRNRCQNDPQAMTSA
jgi:hypothetical protein